MTIALVGSDWVTIAAFAPVAILAFVDVGLISIVRWLLRRVVLRKDAT